MSRSSAEFMTARGGHVIPAHAVIDENTLASHEIVAAVAGKRIRVTNLFLVADGPVGVSFTDGTDPITGTLSLGENGGIVLPFSAFGYFETPEGLPLEMDLDAAVQVGGAATYILVED